MVTQAYIDDSGNSPNSPISRRFVGHPIDSYHASAEGITRAAPLRRLELLTGT